MVTSRGKVLVAVAGSVLVVTGIAVASFALHGTPPRDAAARQHVTTLPWLAPAAPAASQGASPAAAADTPAAATAQNHAPATPAQSPAATPASTPAATTPPAAPDPLTACTAIGDTTTDAAGHQVQCAGSGAAPMWMCYSGAYPETYPAVPGQAGPPGGWPTVLDTDATAYVADNQVSGGPGLGVWQWQVTAPPC